MAEALEATSLSRAVAADFAFAMDIDLGFEDLSPRWKIYLGPRCSDFAFAMDIDLGFEHLSPRWKIYLVAEALEATSLSMAMALEDLPHAHHPSPTIVDYKHCGTGKTK